MKRLHVYACQVLWREICHVAAASGSVCRLAFLRQGLHQTPDLLRASLQRAIDQAEEPCDAILLGYGLCSNGVAGLIARRAPLIVPRAHDCITLLLGSKERYREYFDAHPGTYWYSPGWNETGTQPGRERYETQLAEYRMKYGEENAAYLMEMEQGWFKNYSNAAYVDIGLPGAAEGLAYTRACAEWLKWNCEFLTGDAGLLRRFLNGEWDDTAFLTVQPGQTIRASNNERILFAE